MVITPQILVWPNINNVSTFAASYETFIYPCAHGTSAAMTMYDMSRVNGNGYFDADDNEEARLAARKALADERMKAYLYNSDLH